jgi:cyanophycinase
MPEETHSECPVPAGILLIIGGKENKGKDDLENREVPEGFDPLEILQRFVSLIDKDSPVIEVITTASSEGEESFQEYKKLFLDLGAGKVNHIHHINRTEVMDDDLSERVKAADGVFFSGGDQLLLASIYGGTSLLTQLKQRYIAGNVVIAGTSAGAMAMSTPMIYAGNSEVQQISGEIKITTGMEFLKDVCIDTHFVHRGRFIRLAQVIATNPTCIGLGIEEDTAVIVRNGLDVEIVGSGTVIMIEGFGITASNMKDFTDSKSVSIRNLTVHILANKDTFRITQTNPPHI